MTQAELTATENAQPILSIVVPCFNEQEVLHETALRLSELIDALVSEELIAAGSRVVFVDDGSHDHTWSIIEELSVGTPRFSGIKLSTNCGHQNAVMSGLLSSEGDILVSVDADLQDDLNAIRAMVRAHCEGADIVYGVRSSRHVDSRFKRISAESYYRLLRFLGVTVVFNHADFRLMSRRAVEALRRYDEVNLFLRGIVPKLGFRSQIVTYERHERFAGQTKYPLSKMIALALEGITSFSTRPLRWITGLGFTLSILSFLVGLRFVYVRLFENTYVPGWASTVVPMVFLGGIQLLSLGVIGEYLGKVYLETKRRPRFIIERTIGGSFSNTYENRFHRQSRDRIAQLDQ